MQLIPEGWVAALQQLLKKVVAVTALRVVRLVVLELLIPAGAGAAPAPVAALRWQDRLAVQA